MSLKKFIHAIHNGHWKLVVKIYPTLPVDSRSPTYQFLYAKALFAEGKIEDGLSEFLSLAELESYNYDALNSIGYELCEAGFFMDAEVLLRRSLDLSPHYVPALVNLANLMNNQNKIAEAKHLGEKAIYQEQKNPDLYTNLAAYLVHEGSIHSAINALDLCNKAISLDSLNIRARSLIGKIGVILKNCELSVRALQEIQEISPSKNNLLGDLIHAKMLCADWNNLDILYSDLITKIEAAVDFMEPFGFIGLSTSLNHIKKNAAMYVQSKHIRSPKARIEKGFPTKDKKIKVGYVSGEFRDQATSILLVEVIESFDRGKFEVYAFDNGHDDQSQIRSRLHDSFSEIVDISAMSDEEAFSEIRKREVDILVNLNGFFGMSRTDLFAMRPSSVQVNFLGFPATMGAKFMDYIVADRIVLPVSEENFYYEKPAYISGSYQCNDSKRMISKSLMLRKDHSLPDNDFVFACFNNAYKITPSHFFVWMNILRRVPGSVLWLLSDSDAVTRNLSREAAALGIAPERLVFARRMKPEQHLKRHELADLFLDTLPYNAHTTASDALWSGLPVLTCRGTTFPGRVATSLLKQLCLEELITENLQAYEDLAVALALNPKRLSEIKQKLAIQRNQSDLFDGRAYARKLESLFVQMYEKSRNGEPPGVIYSY